MVSSLLPLWLSTQLEQHRIVEDPVQHTQQGVVFIELVPPCSGHGVAGEDHVEASFLVVPAVHKVEEQPGVLGIEDTVPDFIDDQTGRLDQVADHLSFIAEPPGRREHVVEL